MRGDVFRVLQRELPCPTFGAELVTVVGNVPDTDARIGTINELDESIGSTPTITTVVERLKKEAHLYAHRFASPAKDAKILAEEQRLGILLAPQHAQILRSSNGARLFTNGLEFYSIGSDDEASIEWAIDLTSTQQYPLTEGLVPFAESPQSAIVWAYDQSGIVRGLGRGGVTYGPMRLLRLGSQIKSQTFVIFGTTEQN